jgi:hypothetical protein
MVGRTALCTPIPAVCKAAGAVYAGRMSVQRFPIRLGARSLILLRIWGVKPGLAFAEVDEVGGELNARFGRVRFSTELANIATWRIEGPFHWITAIGIRRSVRHGDLSFAGAAHGGVRMDFREPVKWSFFRVPALYIAADDLDSFAAALRDRGIPGEDARRTRHRPE